LLRMLCQVSWSLHHEAQAFPPGNIITLRFGATSRRGCAAACGKGLADCCRAGKGAVLGLSAWANSRLAPCTRRKSSDEFAHPYCSSLEPKKRGGIVG